MAWTEDRVEVLTKLWADGLSASQIAKELGGVTRNAVIGKVHRLGLSGRAKPSRPKKVASVKSATPRKRTVTAKRTPTRTVTRPAAPITPPAPPPLLAKKLPNGEYATIMTIRDHMCKWPIGDPMDDDFRFCGRKNKSGEPYCESHCNVAYQPSRRRGSSNTKSLPPRRPTRYIT